MSYRIVTGNDLRAMARLVDAGLADGELHIELDLPNNFDYVGDRYDSRSTRIQPSGDRYTLEMRVWGSIPDISPQQRAYEQYNPSPEEIARRARAVVQQELNSPSRVLDERPVGQVEIARILDAVLAPPPAPKIDPQPALERFIEIVKVIVRAWASDDNKIRFALLELD